MEFLLKYNLTSEEIEYIEKMNSENTLRNIKMNLVNVTSVIDYLLGLGITTETLKELFVHQIGIFHKTKAEIEQVFDEYEIESIVKSLNFDVNTLDLIEFN